MNGLVMLLIGFVAGGGLLFFYLKLTSDKTLLNARESAQKVIKDAEKEAETLKKETVIEAEEEAYQLKEKFEQDYEVQRQKLRETEERLDERELEVDRKAEYVENKEREVNTLEKEIVDKENHLRERSNELKQAESKQQQKLQEIAGLSMEEARKILLADMEQDVAEEAQRITQSILEQSRLEANRKAREIVIQAIQQVSPEQSVESTVSVVTLPADDMKGRIIGREGRNIRAFEMASGVDVIIDDTPEIVVLSSYNSYRREIARLALEKLITDGRIHPARIEEVIQKTGEEMQESLQEIGEQALLEIGIHGIVPEIAGYIGKLKYRTSYGQNVLSHSIEVAHLCGIMAAELGLDVKIAKRAGMLHDIGKSLDTYSESNHARLGADLLRKHNEHPKVVNAAEAHHNEREASSPITLLVMAADVISGQRPGARRESLETFIKRMEHLEDIARNFGGVEKAYSIQAGREVRVIVETDQVDDARARGLAREIAHEIQSKIEFPGQIKVTVIREYRGYDYAT